MRDVWFVRESWDRNYNGLDEWGIPVYVSMKEAKRFSREEAETFITWYYSLTGILLYKAKA